MSSIFVTHSKSKSPTPPTSTAVHARKLWLEIGPTFILAAGDLGFSEAKSKMADQCEVTEGELVISIKEALKHEKSKFERRISNAHKLKDLDNTFQELNQLAEVVVKAKFGALRKRPKYRIGELYPMLERNMIRAKTAIYRRLSSKMSKLHPWIVCFDLPMAQEVFNLLHKEILGITRYGVEVKETPRSVAITFSSLRRLCHLFDQFEDCGGFKKQLGEGKGEAKLIVNDEKKGTMVYNAKEEILRAKFYYGHWNCYGISQH